MDKDILALRYRALKYLGVLCAAILVFGILTALLAQRISAAENTVYLTEDTWIEYNPSDAQYGTTTNMRVTGLAADPARALLKIPNQTGGGNVTSVLLKVFYQWYNEDNPSGKELRCYRLTSSFAETQATWLKRTTTNYWTTEGGDYTTYQYASCYLPSSHYQYITFDITNMAKYQWETLGGDLYVVIRFRYETDAYPDVETMIGLASAEETEAGELRPKVVVTYADETPDPEVSMQVDEIGDNWVDLEITPNLYGCSSATVYTQASLKDQNNWIYTSTGQVVTTNDPVIERLTGLAESTDYDVRAKLVGCSTTAYSAEDEITTADYTVPTFDCYTTDVNVYDADVRAEYEGNDDLKSVYMKVYYRELGEGTWTSTTNVVKSTTGGYADWTLQPLAGHEITYQFYAQFVIEGDYYYTDIDTFQVGNVVDLDIDVDDKGIDFLDFELWYDCRDIDSADIWMRVKPDGALYWLNSDPYEDQTSYGYLEFVFQNLQPGVKYYYQAVAESQYGTVYTSGNDYVWTSDVTVVPIMTDVKATFTQPYTVTFSAQVDINDAQAYTTNLVLYLDGPLEGCPPGGYNWREMGRTTVTADGTWAVQLICGDKLDWQALYAYKLVLNYVVGEITSDPKCFNTPEIPYGLLTLDPRNVTNDSAILCGYFQAGEGMTGHQDVAFVYWETGSSNKRWTTEQELTETQVFEHLLTNLVRGREYSYQAWCSFMQDYGEIKTFTPGTGTGGGGIPGIPDIVTDYLPIGVIQVIVAIAVTAGIGFFCIWKLKGRNGQLVALVAMTGSLIVFGLLGWLAPWIILMLAVVIATIFIMTIRRALGGGDA